jgi:uncharacterized membrane protein
MGRYYGSPGPVSAWGVASVGAAVAYVILERAIVAVNGSDSAVAQAIGSEVKGTVSLILYLAGIGLAWVPKPVGPYLSYAPYTAVAFIWFVPDRRFARQHAATDD